MKTYNECSEHVAVFDKNYFLVNIVPSVFLYEISSSEEPFFAGELPGAWYTFLLVPAETGWRPYLEQKVFSVLKPRPQQPLLQSPEWE